MRRWAMLLPLTCATCDPPPKQILVYLPAWYLDEQCRTVAEVSRPAEYWFDFVTAQCLSSMMLTCARTDDGFCTVISGLCPGEPIDPWLQVSEPSCCVPRTSSLQNEVASWPACPEEYGDPQ